MSLDSPTVHKLGRLARIAIEEKHAETIAAELSSVLNWIEQLQEVKVDGITPMTSVLHSEAPLREDVVNDGNDPDRILANAPKAIKGYFSVPKVIE